MSPKQELFCREYQLDVNATQAAIRAGYSARSAHVSGHRLLSNTKVAAKIAELACARFAHLDLTAERLDRELAKVAFFNLGRISFVTEAGDPYTDLGRADDDDMAAIAAIQIEDYLDRREVDEGGRPLVREVRRVKLKAHDKIAALALAYRRLGLLKHRLELLASEDFGALMEAAMRRVAAP